MSARPGLLALVLSSSASSVLLAAALPTQWSSRHHCSNKSSNSATNTAQRSQRNEARVEFRDTTILDYAKWAAATVLGLYVLTLLLGPDSFVSRFLSGLSWIVNSAIIFIGFFFGF